MGLHDAARGQVFAVVRIGEPDATGARARGAVHAVDEPAEHAATHAGRTVEEPSQASHGDNDSRNAGEPCGDRTVDVGLGPEGDYDVEPFAAKRTEQRPEICEVTNRVNETSGGDFDMLRAEIVHLSRVDVAGADRSQPHVLPAP